MHLHSSIKNECSLLLGAAPAQRNGVQRQKQQKPA
jgi:hypothetical protein